MKLQIKFFLTIVGTTFALCAVAMENEPNGFRGLEWGASVKDIQWPYYEAPISPDREVSEEERYYIGNENALNMNTPRHGLTPRSVEQQMHRWVEENIHRVGRGGDKAEFGGAPVSVSYIFYKGRFIAGAMRYQTQSSGVSMTDYQSKAKVREALTTYFGESDYAKLSFLERFKPENIAKPAYSGEKTTIRHMCKAVSQDYSTIENCLLFFEAKDAFVKMQGDLTALRLSLAGEVQRNILTKATEESTKKDY